MSDSGSSSAPGARDDLIQDAKANNNGNLNPGNWIEAYDTREWSSGFLGVDGNAKWSSLSNNLKWHNESFKRDYAFAAYQKGDFTLGGSGRTVVGFRVRSHWNDGTNGWFKIVEGGVGSSTVKVEFSSYKTRGCDWSVEAWTI